MVQFGNYLINNINSTFSNIDNFNVPENYINYNQLKEILKKNKNNWNNNNEVEFIENLESNLNKIYDIVRNEYKQIINKLNKFQDLSGDDVEDENLDYDTLELELNNLISSLYDLDKFIRLNYSGFSKILKKHDKLYPNFILKPIFEIRLNNKPFFKILENYDYLVIKLSNINEKIKNKGNKPSYDKQNSSAGGKQTNFVRQTTKYWVHPDNITQVKLKILKNLPVLVFNPDKEFNKSDMAISSIYFDNEDLDLYYGRLRKDEGAEAHRIRWYGGMQTNTIFVERKTHREDWTGEKSIKARFSTKEKNINDFLKGNYQLNEVTAPNQSKENIQLSKEIQYFHLKHHLRPVVRSFYHRTAYQLPGDARVRCSLDSELTLIREDNFDGYDRTHNNWRRMDIGIDWPFSNLPEKDVERFPYAVLEVKLQTQLGQEPPTWIKELISSNLVESVPKFSKFLHGVATLLPNMVQQVPFWIPQMDVDIRKPSPNAIHNRKLHEAAAATAAIGYNGAKGNQLDEEEMVGGFSSYGALQADDIEDLEEAENYIPTTVSKESPNAAFLKEKILSSNQNSLPQLFWKACLVIDSFLYSGNESIVTTTPDSYYTTDIRAPEGKTIYVPIRIEPKVYFATERTFLSWISIILTLNSLNLLLLNYGSQANMITSLGFSFCCLFMLIWETYIYLKRCVAIRMKWNTEGTFEDKIGVNSIVVLLLSSFVFGWFVTLKQS
ncbi:hypothetical protein ACO0SA_002402 [Hanseniaspora valbyensis]